ncbi:MAG: hypothetical protein JJU36_05090 [Phycisphaeraceae bacterium]|nr:hypothetical protein [Phycisphaeraceae bacterium]
MHWIEADLRAGIQTVAEMIVDGANLLYHEMPPELAGLDRDGLCRLMAGLARWQGKPLSRILLVFDGKPSPPAFLRPDDSTLSDTRILPGSGSMGGRVGDVLEFRYSGPDREADALIFEAIGRSDAPRGLFVVTRDRAIQKVARARRAKVVEPSVLIAHLERRCTTGGDASGGGRQAAKPQARGDGSALADYVRWFGPDAIKPPEAPQLDDRLKRMVRKTGARRG